MRRAVALLLGFGFLAATGVASGTPCCTLTHLAGPPAVTSPDCCDSPDCCRGEKRGPAQATLSAKAPDTAARAMLIAASPVSHARTAGTILAGFGEPLVLKDHSPPLDRRETRLLISLFRV
jgi:hypothetical protein